MLTVVIQAGGASRRMGQDKALIPFLGQPLIQRVIERVRPIANELLVTTNNPQGLDFLKIPLIPDVLPGYGALGGLYTALLSAHHPLVGVVACDLPFVNGHLLALECDRLDQSQADVAIPLTGRGYEPFQAVYRRATCLDPIQAALAAGERRVDSWFSKVKLEILSTELLSLSEPDTVIFWNLNTPEDVQMAEDFARHQI
jgi:molybdopterin-guanine dinucleotide biosynthesis protein A